MSDEVLIQTIRVAMRDEVAGLEPPSDLADRLPSPGRGWRMPPLGWMAPALAVGVAALVAVVAVRSLSHRAASGGASTAVPFGARGLARDLAVLRRRQRPGDMLSGRAVREVESLTDQAKVIAGLTRRVGSVNLGQYGRAKVYLVVQTPPRFPLHRRHIGPPVLSPRLGDRATIAFVGPFREEAAITGGAVAAGGVEVAATGHGLTADPGQTTDLWGAVASIVPDGVWRVKWVFQTTGSAPRQITVWPHLHDNVAIGHPPPRLQVFLKGAVWYGAHGQVMSSFGRSSGSSLSALNFKRAFEASLRDRVDPVLARHLGVLRRPRGKAQVPGLDHASVASLIEPNPLGLNIEQTRFVAYVPTPAKVLIVPGTQGLALRVLSPLVGQAEAGTSLALDGGLFIVGPRVSGHRRIVGLAPDGNRTVKVLLPSGMFRTAPVIDNLYCINAPSGARTLLLRNAAGRTIRLRL